MNVAKRMTAVLLMALMLVLPVYDALAEVSQRGGIAAEGNGLVYIILDEGSGSALNSISSLGGELQLVESCPIIDDLVMVGSDLYYIRENGTYQLVRYDASGAGVILTEFTTEENETVERLSYYGEVLYCLVGGKLTIVDPTSGETQMLSELLMNDYVILDDVIYYISSADVRSYEWYNKDAGSTVTKSAGTLYSMSISGGNPEKMLDIGIENLKAEGDHLYFNNLEDHYPMGTADDVWLKGYLHRHNIQTGQTSSMGIGYDWDFYPTPNGVVVYTQNDISIYPLTGGTPVQLMTPEMYTKLFAQGDYAYVYEQTNGILTKLPVNGLQAVQLTGGAKLVDDQGNEVDDPWDLTTDDTTDDSTDDNTSDDSSDDNSSDDNSSNDNSSSSSGKDSSYIFKNSNKKKLTRKQILNVDKKLWAYARNEIYARHGYKFKTKKYADYFKKKSWYKQGGFSTSDLNSTEWYNMDLLKAMEDEYGVGSGSSSGGSSSGGSSTGTDGSYLLKNSNKKKLKESDVKKLDKKWWPYARNEIYARHGYSFKTKKYANYFKKKSWYKEGGFSTSDLSDIEWYNMELIKKMEDKY